MYVGEQEWKAAWEQLKGQRTVSPLTMGLLQGVAVSPYLYMQTFTRDI